MNPPVQLQWGDKMNQVLQLASDMSWRLFSMLPQACLLLQKNMLCLSLGLHPVPFSWLQWAGWGDAATAEGWASSWLLLELSVPASRHTEWTQNNVWKASQPQVKVLQNVAAVRAFGNACVGLGGHNKCTQTRFEMAKTFYFFTFFNFREPHR